ncbi:MAG TPA: CHASE domain-containing protein [Burkholderiaceae bacterium]|nr:CHASE domain-containing protein [Burkholderiaceae bacterium]
MLKRGLPLWVLAFVLALAITAATFSFVRQYEVNRAQAEFRASAVQRTDLLQADIALATSELTALGAYFDASSNIDRQTFHRLAHSILKTGSPIRAIEWIPRVPAEQRSRFEQTARRDGFTSFEFTQREEQGSMVSADARAEYYPVYFVEPLQGNEKALGFDLSSNSARRAALEKSMITGELCATSRVNLVQENSGQYGFLAFRPVYRGGVVPEGFAKRKANLVGFVLGVFRIGDMVQSGIEDISSKVQLTLIDADAEPGKRLLYPNAADNDGTDALPSDNKVTRVLPVAGRFWTVIATPRPGVFEANHYGSTSILVLGVLISVLWSAYLRQMLVRQSDIKEAIELRTRDLRQERNFSNAVFTSAGAIILVVDRGGRIVRFNNAAEAFTGYSSDEVKAQPYFWENFLPPEERARGREIFARFDADGSARRFEASWQSRSGERRLFDWTTSVLLDDQDSPQYLIAIGLDISAQKRLEEAAKQQETWLRTILDHLGEGVYTLDARGRLSYMNAQAEQLLGWKSEELKDKPIHNIIHHHRPDGSLLPAVECPIYLAMQDKRVYRSNEEVFFCKDGTRLPVKVSGAPLVLEGRHSGSVVLFSDVRNETLLQQRLVKAKEAAEQADRLKTDFLSTMSHEMRTPLNGVIGMTDLLLDTSLDTEQVEFVRIIKTSADTLVSTINDILDFSKIEAGRLELEKTDFSLRQLVESTIDVLANRASEKKLTLASFVESSLPDHFVGDPLRIRQVLLNFLANAVKFSDEGQIVVSAQADQRDSACATLRLSVRDDGIGISEQAMSRLFEPFSQADSSTTRKYGGTGLGLAICRRLVEAMGGKIGVESTPGHGSTFWASIPLNFGEPPPAGVTNPTQGRLAFVVGETAQNREIWHRYLEDWQMRYQSAEDLSGLQERLQALGSGPKPDVLLLIEPLGDAGIEEAAARTLAQGIPIVCCLRDATKELRARLSDRGIAVIQKPIKQSTLLDAMLRAWSSSAKAPVQLPIQAPTLDFSPSATRARRILLAEDNQVNQRVAVLMLKRLGYEVDIAENGAAAARMAAAGDYALVLMDCQMPEMDGFEATVAIRVQEIETGRHIPIIAMTANALQGDREQCVASGMDDYISKPIDIERLREALTIWTRSPEADIAPSTPSTTAAQRPPSDMDMTRLTEMFGDDRPAIVDLLGAFRESLQRLRERMQREVSSRGTNVKALAHEMKGMASNMGATRLATLAAQVEGAALRDDWSSIENGARSLEGEIALLDAFVDDYIKG